MNIDLITRAAEYAAGHPKETIASIASRFGVTAESVSVCMHLQGGGEVVTLAGPLVIQRSRLPSMRSITQRKQLKSALTCLVSARKQLAPTCRDTGLVGGNAVTAEGLAVKTSRKPFSMRLRIRANLWRRLGECLAYRALQSLIA